MAIGPYSTSFLASSRLVVKWHLLVPATRLMALVFPIFLLLPVIRLLKTGFWAASPLLLLLYGFLVLFFALFSLPISMLINWLRQRNLGSTTTSLQLESALDASRARTTELPWSEVRSVKSWGSDLFIHGARKGIVVPREAFESPVAAQSFAHLAISLRENAKNPNL